MHNRREILVVGQTPPPYGGQALMIKYLLDGQFEGIEMHHVRMAFSREFNDRGKFSMYKILHVFTIILNIWKIWCKHKPEVMYYPPSSAPKVAVLRDVAILMCTRFLFKKVVFHFHASGISEELPMYNRFLKMIVYFVLKKPDIAITSSEHNPDDASFLKAKKTIILPLGIPDENTQMLRKGFGTKKHLDVMFMGLLNSTKGEGYVLDAINVLNKKGLDVRMNFAGKFETDEYQNEFMAKVAEYKLQDKVQYKGIVTGDTKKQLFLDSDVFCFPSFFSSESFGMVLLEGMMYQMPLIASRWRGVQSVVVEGENGYLVPIKNAEEIAERLEELYNNRAMLKRMAIRSREIFEEKYILDKYLKELEKILKTA